MEKLLLNPNEVISVDPTTKGVYVNKELITEKEVQQLQAEVRALVHFRIWDMFQETIKARAIEMTMLSSALDKDEVKLARMMAGQMMLHNLTIMQQIVNTIDQYDR